MRGIARGLCSGQNAVRELTRRFPKLAATLNLRPLATDDVMLGQLSKGNSIRECTPLWVYVMREADVATGARLGALGGWLLADTLRTAALSADIGLRDPTSPRLYELYPPFVNAAGGRDAITVEDVISYTYDRP